MFNFKHFTGLQWYGFAAILNFILVLAMRFTGQYAPIGIIVISAVGAGFAVLFIKWPSSTGFETDKSNDTDDE